MHDGLHARARAGAGSVGSRRRDHRRRPRLLRRPGPAGVLERRGRRRRQPARELPPQRARDPRAREAGDRRRQRPGRRRRHVARARLRRPHRRRLRRASSRRSSTSASSPTPAARGSCAGCSATARAFEWLTTGRRLGAEEARTWGLVERGRAGRRARAPRAGGRRALRGDADARRLGDEATARRAPRRRRFAEQLELEAVTQAELTQTHDFREGVAAFLAKREAEFTGADVERPHPITVVNADDRRRWRLTTALRWLLALPHIYLARATGRSSPCSSRSSTGSSRSSRGRHAATRCTRGSTRYVRYSTHVDAYVCCVADPYPKFRGWPGTLPGRPARRPAGRAVALEDRCPDRARDPRARLRVRARRSSAPWSPSSRGSSRSRPRACPSASSDLGVVLPALPGADARLPAAPHRQVPDARERVQR